MHSRRNPISFAVAMLLAVAAPAQALADDAEPGAVAPPPPNGALGWRGPRPPITEEEDSRHSTGMMVTGVILTSCGIVNGLTGVGFAVASAACNGELCVFFTIGALGFSGVGIALMSIGIPLWVVGGGEPRSDGDESASASARTAAPTMVVGPGTIGARWSF
jgi:hypothetical protein